MKSPVLCQFAMLQFYQACSTTLRGILIIPIRIIDPFDKKKVKKKYFHEIVNSKELNVIISLCGLGW